MSGLLLHVKTFVCLYLFYNKVLIR